MYCCRVLRISWLFYLATDLGCERQTFTIDGNQGFHGDRNYSICSLELCIIIIRVYIYVTDSALKITLNARVDELNRALNRLGLISRQDALLILRSSLGVPNLIYNLQSVPSSNHPSLTEYDQCLALLSADHFLWD